MIPDKEWDLLGAHFGSEKESLKGLSDNLFIFNHSITLPISALIKLSALALLFMSLKESIVLDNVVSSAYMIKSNLLLH